MAVSSLRSLINLQSTTCFNYAPSPGRPEIRALWKEMLARKNPLLAGLPETAISLPEVTCALTHGLSLCGYLFLRCRRYRHHAGPALGELRPSLRQWLRRLGHVLSDLQRPGFNVAGLRSKLLEGKPGKRVLLLNFPNNPTGYTVTSAEAAAIRDVCIEAAEAGSTVLAIVDDAYFGLVYEPGILKESNLRHALQRT